MSTVFFGTPARLILTQDNTQILNVYGLMDLVTGNFVNDSVNMTATLLDQNRNQVAGCIDVTMTYVSGSNGNYQGVFGNSGSFSPAVGSGYTMVLDGDGIGGSSHYHREIPADVITAKY